MNIKLPGLFAAVSLLLVINANAAVQLVPSTTSIYVNDSFTISVQASSQASALNNIDSASVQLSYDQNFLQLDGISLAGGSAFCDLVVRDAVANDGLVEGVYAMAHQPDGTSCPALSGDFVAFQIQMTALASGSAALSITQNGIGLGWTSQDSPGVPVAGADAMPLQINIALPPDVDGDGVIDSLDNCINTANTDQADTGGIGSNLPDGIGDACQCGDVNADGRVTNTDSILIKRNLLGLPSPFNADFCDVNGDSKCSNTDAILIQRALLNLPPGLRQTCTAAGI